MDDPTNGFYAPTLSAKGAVAEMAFNDGVREILLGRSPMSAYDGLVKDWLAAVGTTAKMEYEQAHAATR